MNNDKQIFVTPVAVNDVQVKGAVDYAATMLPALSLKIIGQMGIYLPALRLKVWHIILAFPGKQT